MGTVGLRRCAVVVLLKRYSVLFVLLAAAVFILFHSTLPAARRGNELQQRHRVEQEQLERLMDEAERQRLMREALRDRDAAVLERELQQRFVSPENHQNSGTNAGR
jgi:predicted Holliday junction resolvase-like endonuclease